MRNNILKKTVAGLIIVLSFVGVAKAGDSISFSVSCTIPAIPGVNAPPFPEEKIAQLQVQQTVEQKAKEEETRTEAPAMIQEDSVDIKTIYPR